MFKLNLKIALRNLYKNKAYTAINIAGLALGLAGFIFILLYINYEKSYDTWDKELDKVYQVQELDLFSLKEGKAEWRGESDGRLREMIKAGLPNVVAVTHVYEAEQDEAIVIDNKGAFFINDVQRADSMFFSVFPYKFIHGNPAGALRNLNDMVISEDFAKKYFGDVNPVGKVVKLTSQAWVNQTTHYTITGVIAKPETPSIFDFNVLVQAPNLKFTDRALYFRPNYVKFSEKQNEQNINQSLQKIYEPFRAAMLKKWKWSPSEYLKNGNKPAVRLKPFYSVHQEPLQQEDWLKQLKPIILLSSLLLLISIINFMNMFTAQAVSRAKEVGIRKVTGASRASLIKQFLLETALQCFCALILGVILLELFLPYLNEQFSLALSIADSYSIGLVSLQLIGLVTLITLLSGIYPAIFLSSYDPHNVLKGNFAQGKKGSKLRVALVGMQFVIAVGFFIGILIISSQIKYMESRDPGFDPTGIIYVNEPMNKVLSDRIRNIEGVKYVAVNNGNVRRHPNITADYKYNNEVKELNTVFVNLEGLQAVGAKLINGRFFDKLHKQDTSRTVIINESLEKLYGGDMLNKYITYNNDSVRVQVVGIIKDIQVTGFDKVSPPTIYTASEFNATDYTNDGFANLVTYDTKKEKHVLAEFNKIWRQASPDYPLSFSFLEHDFKKLFVSHERFKQMVKLFSLLSISLSMIGLFSLAAFMTRQRTKEIAIRKVLGADDKDIFFLLNKGYLWLMLGANVVACPLIYIAVQHWLAGFAYRIEMPVFPFLIAFIVSILVTALTVSVQVKNAVKANPVDALKYE
ncbi:ABC transporter permease [Pedobacter frigoris]|uniref:FtsX-like permease family protein n=1 Tax=Pedobacter frigoris TaxID=2571272 RepID=A0A4U1CM05_9SPHI|nr:ABC transporter permease [Pedobacter frigoris]TKC08877.1 FtsX-like permease family protein [Pedobacter frigoris]